MEQSVSIVIPCKVVDEYAAQCVERCLSLRHEPKEVVLLADSLPANEIPGVKIIATGPITPGAKRNLGLRNSKGEVIAFIDSDAYPRDDWLENALHHLGGDEVIGVGGPGLTPPEDSSLQKAGGMILKSSLMGGLARRYSERGTVESNDIHSCNLIVKRGALKNASWNEKYWPGEDTLLSLDLSKKNQGKMLEARDVVVYHHRRPLFVRHLKQVFAFGLHRGFFTKRYPENSRKAVYALPSLALIAFITMILLSLLVSPYFLALVALVMVAYAVASIGPSSENARLFPAVWIGLMATHFAYGIAYIEGVLRRELPR